VFKSEYAESVYVAAIREENGRVFMRKFSLSFEYDEVCEFGWSNGLDSIVSNQELLIYDFNLGIGDSLNHQVVVAEDSVNLGDGLLRKTLLLESNSGTQTLWTEGIGSEKGLFEGYCYEFENWYYLKCYEDGSLTYPNPCLNVSTPEINSTENLLVSRTPHNDYILVKNTNGLKSTMTIHNMLGELIVQNTAMGRKTKVNLEGLESGLYLITFIDSEKTIRSQKLVISRP